MSSNQERSPDYGLPAYPRTARCNNWREDLDRPCEGGGLIFWTPDQVEAPCHVCGARCGRDVAEYDSRAYPVRTEFYTLAEDLYGCPDADDVDRIVFALLARVATPIPPGSGDTP